MHFSFGWHCSTVLWDEAVKILITRFVLFHCGSSSLGSTNWPLIKIRCDFPLFDHPEGSVPMWPLAGACHSSSTIWPDVFPLGSVPPVTQVRPSHCDHGKETQQQQNWPKAGHIHLLQNVSLDQRNDVPFFHRWSLTGKALDLAAELVFRKRLSWSPDSDSKEQICCDAVENHQGKQKRFFLVGALSRTSKSCWHKKYDKCWSDLTTLLLRYIAT